MKVPDDDRPAGFGLGSWRLIKGPDGAQWPIHFERDTNGKYVVTVWRPTSISAARAALAGADIGQRYWRGESLISMDEAGENCVMAIRMWQLETGKLPEPHEPEPHKPVMDA